MSRYKRSVVPRESLFVEALGFILVQLAAAYLMQLPAFSQTLASGSSRGTKPEDYRTFAMGHDGDAIHGKAIFANEQAAACVRCHSIDGKGSKVGPDLFSVGDRFSRREIVDSILAPSATIAVGYSTTSVETKSGMDYQGVLKQSSAVGIELALADGKRVSIAQEDIKNQQGSSLSLMPEGLQASLSLQDFTDLVEFLMTLKESRHYAQRQHGMPETIPALSTPARLVPFLPLNLQSPSQRVSPAGVSSSGLVWFDQIPGQPHLFLALHQTGLIWLVDKSSSTDSISLFADLTPKVFSARGPNGLLGLTFHPKFGVNRRYYLKYQILDEGKIATVLEERVMASDFRSVSDLPPRELLRIPSGAEHHNGGCIAFGPDGMLYIGMGDSAPNFDPQGHSQDLGLLLGKMLRIDVDRSTSDRPYGIPTNNPFRHRPHARPEIWAYGLREPWRFSFDRLTGNLWVADLGQERGDEVEVIRRGENYGWNVYEGFEFFTKTNVQTSEKYTAPLFSTRRHQGSCLIGGCVYRGDRHSSFYGVYIFGDHQSKKVWGLTASHGRLGRVRELAVAPQSITAIVADERGDLYVVGYQGMVYQLDLSAAHFNEVAPHQVSLTRAGK